MASDFSINGSVVNSRVDWQHRPLQAGPTSSRLEGFPGYGGAFAVRGPRGVARFSVSGWLVGATLGVLMDEVAQHDALRSAAGTLTVRIHGRTYTRCVLDGLAPLGKNVPFKDGLGVTFQRRRYRFDFVRLEAA